MGFMSTLGNTLDYIGTAARLPEFGISEAVNGGRSTANTGGSGGYNSPLNQGLPIGKVEQAVRGFNAPNVSRTVSNPVTQPTNTTVDNTNQRITTPAPGGGAPAQVYPDKTNDILLNRAALAAADTQQSSGLAAIQKALERIFGGYDAESASNEGNYSAQSVTNKQNQQQATQAALLHGAQGRRSLFGTLASLGALSGTGIEKANNLVREGVNDDLSGADSAYTEDQTNLDTNIGLFREADKRRRLDDEAEAEDARGGIRNQAVANRQKALVALADNFAAMGNKAEAAKYAQEAAALYPDVARTSVPAAGPTYTPYAFTPTTLSNYIGGSGGSAVSTAPTAGSAIPGLAATPGLARRRRDV